jgi:hypothetical protein
VDKYLEVRFSELVWSERGPFNVMPLH